MDRSVGKEPEDDLAEAYMGHDHDQLSEKSLRALTREAGRVMRRHALRQARLRQIRDWSDHPEDMTLLGPSPADVGALLDEVAELREAVALVHGYLDVGAPLDAASVANLRGVLRRVLPR